MSAPFIPPPLIAFPLIRDWVSFASDGEVHLLSGRVELGQGITTALIQIAADELDVDMGATSMLPPRQRHHCAASTVVIPRLSR